MKPIIIIDVDGTITNFSEIDRKIIKKIFPSNLFVNILDRLLWNINGLDYITNRFWIFKFRIFIYSLLSFSNFNVNMRKYEREYVKESKKQFDVYLNEYNIILKKMGLDILLLSHNKFAHFLDDSVHSVKDKRKYVLNNIYGNYDIVYIVGNNYMDDIRLGFKLKKIRAKLENGKKTTNVVYIGKSKFLIDIVLNGKNVFVYDSFKEFVNSLKKE